MQRELCPSLLKTPGTTPPPPPGLLKNRREGAPEGKQLQESIQVKLNPQTHIGSKATGDVSPGH